LYQLRGQALPEERTEAWLAATDKVSVVRTLLRIRHLEAGDGQINVR
jgi:hypothetical protein